MRAVAASALLPVADTAPAIVPHEVPPPPHSTLPPPSPQHPPAHLPCPAQVPALLCILWDALLDLDDLSASTAAIMDLLSTLLSQQPGPAPQPGPALPVLLPRLWPFLSHSISSVRRSALRTLLSITNSLPAAPATPSTADGR